MGFTTTKIQRLLRGWRAGGLALILCVLMGAPVWGFDLRVIDQDGNPISTGFRWLVEEDNSVLTVPGAKVANSISNSIHNSYAPVVAKGNSNGPTATIEVPGDKRYFVSVFPYDFAYSMSGTVVPAATDFDFKGNPITVIVNAGPIPTAQISVLAFADHSPINNAPDAGEAGLGGATVVISDLGGPVMQNAFGHPLGTTYKACPDTGGMLDGSGAPCVDMLGSGVITTMTAADVNDPAKNPYGLQVGEALIKYIAPGKYGVIVIPPKADESGTPVEWIQTATIEGTPTIDAWVQADEPTLFIEGFGTGFNHVSFGFVDPAALPWANPANRMDPVTGQPGTGSIAGTNVYNHFSRPPANQGYFPGEPVPECWVGLNDPVTQQGLYAAPCDAASHFSITGVPAGTYQLVTWDKPLDALFGFYTVTVPPGTGNGEAVNLGHVLSFRWFGTLEGKVFYDLDEDGFPDPSEPGLAQQNVNLRFRNGTIYQAQPTDMTGEYQFAEVFPFFKWLVAEVDFARFKATGLTAVVDSGGQVTPDRGWAWPSRDKLRPQPQAAVESNPPPGPPYDGAPYRTETGPVLTQAMHLFLNQTNLIYWGKAPYGPGQDGLFGTADDENGGISGMIFATVTRAENDPRMAVAEPWEPGIPRVQVNLYRDSNRDGQIDDINLPIGVQYPDIDHPPLGNFPGAEDVDRNGNGVFEFGDAFDVTWSDSWDDSKPTGCVQPTLPVVHGSTIAECADAYGTWNQVRPGVFDGGYAFGPDLPRDTYIVEAVTPPGFELVKEEDKNVDFGDNFTPSTQLLPAACVGDVRQVPQYMSMVTDSAGTLLPGIAASPDLEAPFAGQNRPLCDRKQVAVVGGKNTAADFFFFTDTPKAARVVGFSNNDLSAEFDTTSPVFGEKSAPSWLPVAIRDWNGNELFRVYTDEFGSYNALIPSTANINLPMPSGVAPNMITVVLNDPFRPDGTLDPFYDPNYSVTPWTLQYTPGQVTYLDTPLVPVAAFAGYPKGGVDANPADGVPVIDAVTGPGPAVGPLVCTNGGARSVSITSLGATEVPNPNYNPQDPASTVTIVRDFGFGTTPGTVTLDGVPLIIDSWTDGAIQATVPAALGTGRLVVTRGDNGQASPAAVTLNIVDCSATAVLTVDDNGPADYGTIQAAIDAASPGALILVAPGVYNEMVIMWKPVRLQGAGPASTSINGNPTPSTRLAAWHAKVLSLLGTDPFRANEGPAIMVTGRPAGAGAVDERMDFDAAPSRIDGFTVLGALAGGGIDVNNDAAGLVISNNRVTNNQGNYGGGIVIGAPQASSPNPGIVIRDNLILKNGGIQGPGGIAIYGGAAGYLVENNLIQGNFSRANGGGIGHLGLSDDGLIRDNRILFNEVFNGLNLAGAGDGGGLFVGSDPTMGEGAGSVTIDANLIQGNLAGAGFGGGIRVNAFDTPAGAAANTLNLFSNIIANNVAGLSAGGVSLQSVTHANVLHNTIAHNDSTATGANAFTPGSTDSAGLPAGLVANAANPTLVNNIILNNRSFSYSHAANNLQGGLVANGFWDLGGTVDPEGCLLTSLTGPSGENFNDGTNIAWNGGPLFVRSYVNDLKTAAVIDEGGNAINVKFTRLDATAGDYHLVGGSQGVDAGNVAPAPHPELALDFDAEARPSGGAPDLGADEVASLTLRIITPNGGETLISGTVYRIVWEGLPNATSYGVHYSLDNGASWRVVGKTGALTAIDWKVPAVAAAETGVRVRVQAFDAAPVLIGRDLSDRAFTIVPSPFAVTYPNGGETFTSGTVETIRWTADPAAASYRVQYSLDNGATWKRIQDLSATSASWKVPAVAAPQAALVRVVAFDASGKALRVDVSDAPLTIVPNPFRVVSPNGGETLTSGTTQAIEWIAAPGAGSYRLLYSLDNGGTWKLIRNVGTAVTTYSWQVPVVPGPQPASRVRVIAFDAAGKTLVADQSDSVFTIQP